MCRIESRDLQWTGTSCACSMQWPRPAASPMPGTRSTSASPPSAGRSRRSEENLQVSLFHRHARGLILTEQGESLNRTVRDVFAKLAMTEALLTESKEKPTGRIKVTTTVGFRLALAGVPRRRLPGQVPGRVDGAAAGRFGPGPGDARGRRRHPHAPAQAAGPGAAPPDDDPLADHGVQGLPEGARHPDPAGGAGRPRADPVRRLPPAGGRHQLAGHGRPPRRPAAPRVARGELARRDGDGGACRRRHRGPAQLDDGGAGGLQSPSCRT